MQRKMASKPVGATGKLLHMPGLRNKNKQNKRAKHSNARESKILQQLIFGMACLLIIMASAIAEGGRFVPALIFSIIGLSGLWYVAKGM